ncbi:MAG: FAD-dependent oxidoreductase [Clostridium sp.]
MIPCIACLQGCVPSMYQGKPLCCLTNPFLGHESEQWKMAETSKKVMVIGGGVGGLCAAFVAAERGHSVTLYGTGHVLGETCAWLPFRLEKEILPIWYAHTFTAVKRMVSGSFWVGRLPWG